MPSFDVVSEIDKQELLNAVDQANREISTRFDFKGTNSKIEISEWILTTISKSEFQIKQINDILKNKINKRGIDVRCLEFGEIIENNNEARETVTIKKGIDKDKAKRIVKMTKNSKLKLQASIQGEQVRVSGKKRDDLQNIISELKEAKFDIPLQFINFRD